MKYLLLAIMSMIGFIGNAIESEGFEPSDLFATMQKGDRAAVLMVHFGTTHDDTRALTIDAVNRKAKELFPTIEVREAWTSRIIIRRLKARGVEKQTPAQALEQLRKEGFTHIIIQSTTLLDGVEMESLRRETADAASSFKELRIGNPLLYDANDYAQVIAALSGSFPSDGATLLVGHGTYKPITACYAMMDYMLKAKGYGNVFVGTIEGYPTFDDALKALKSSGAKRVTLMPLMFVAGEHAQNDIAIKWKEALEKEGFEVRLRLEGLGQNQAIQDLYMKHLTFATTHKPTDIMTKKAAYADGKDKE